MLLSISKNNIKKMKILFSLAFQSLLSRKVTIFLTVISLSVSIILYLSIDTLRLELKKEFLWKC